MTGDGDADGSDDDRRTDDSRDSNGRADDGQADDGQADDGRRWTDEVSADDGRGRPDERTGADGDRGPPDAAGRGGDRPGVADDGRNSLDDAGWSGDGRRRPDDGEGVDDGRPRTDTPAGPDRAAGATGGDGGGSPGDTGGSDLPAEAVEEAERLTRLARRAEGAERAAYLAEREEVAAEHGYRVRVREEDDTLVLHPEEWVEDGTVRTDRVEDLDRAVEVSLSGPGDPEEWSAVAEHNRSVAGAVRAEQGAVHGENADALADFASNHYAKPVEELTPGELREFLDEYFPRNAWPDDRQRRVVERSVELTLEAAGREPPDL